MDQVEHTVVEFLENLEDVQQSILFQKAHIAQKELKHGTGGSLDRAFEHVQNNTDPRAVILTNVLADLREAYRLFVDDSGWPNFASAYLASRARQCRALETLYAERHKFSVISDHFVVAGTATTPRLKAASDAGLRHFERSDSHFEYSLFVPEVYDPQNEWPLIVCLHGGYGQGREYLWTWLRLANTYGYVALSPKSVGQTWSIPHPATDMQSVMSMLDKVCARLSIDQSRIYLSGLSDGGTFSYILGLGHPERFAAVAPIAGVLPPTIDPQLRAGHAKSLPLHVVHGALDAIFPVATVRSTNALLNQLDYNLTYTELPDWGHALTYAINEHIVLPWFEATSSNP
ncbi:MAG: PHB depolymerase family esterase [Pseudomonadota bacterium]